MALWTQLGSNYQVDSQCTVLLCSCWFSKRKFRLGKDTGLNFLILVDNNGQLRNYHLVRFCHRHRSSRADSRYTQFHLLDLYDWNMFQQGMVVGFQFPPDSNVPACNRTNLTK